jgi:glycerol-3-phosphate dehydrogenase (NAD(P)+)
VKVTVLGAGAWGTTVASVISGANDTTLWARRAELADEIDREHTNRRYLADFTLPKSLRGTSDLAAAVGSADVLVVGVPTSGLRAIVEEARPHLRPWVPLVSLSKGFEQGTLLRMTQVIKDVLPGHPVAALTGPNLAKEIMAGQAAAAVIATEDQDVARALQAVFHRARFRVYANHDVVGCEVAGALKNVIAIAAGMAEGLGVGDNTRAAVITRGLHELSRLGVAMGGEPATFSGLAGMGDLVATCMSPQSRNRYVGEQLGKGRTLDEVIGEMTSRSQGVAEGVRTATTVMTLAERHGVAMPICATIHGVVTGESNAQSAYTGLLRVRPGHEDDPD